VTLVPLFVITKVLAPVDAVVPDSLHSVSDAVTVMSAALLPADPDVFDSFAVQPASETPAAIAAIVAVDLMPTDELNFTWFTSQ